jgi:DNA-binding NarL/FixJ family response regulator
LWRDGSDSTIDALVGRSRETAHLATLLKQAADGVSGVLVLLGEPGSGKTALLSQAEAEASGFTVLRSSGSELERGMAFAGLADLLRPLLSFIDELPASLGDSLRSAFVLREGAPADRFATYVAALGLIAVAAEHNPIVVLVDDLHWLDPDSAEAVLFIARRLEAERVVLVIATRDENLDRVAGLPRIALTGVDPDDVDELLRLRTGIALAPAVAWAIHARTAGNPLALIEASRTLDEDQRTGRRALPDPIPVGRQLASAYHRRLLELPESTQQALVIAAACDTSSVAVLAQALANAGLAMTVLEAAEDASLLDIRDGRLHFTHPLIRSSAYHSASVTARRAAHRALAQVTDDPRRQDARAWHLVAASPGPDAGIADQIVEVALGARARHAPAVASQAFEAAAELTPDPAVAAARLLEAALDAQLCGRSVDAIRLAKRAQSGTDDPGVVGRALQIEGRLGFWNGTPGSVAKMARASLLIGEVDLAAGGVALAEAALNSAYEDVSIGLELIVNPLFQHAPALLRQIIGYAAQLTPDTWHWVRAGLIEMLPSLLELDPLANPWVPVTYGRAMVILECWPEARALYESVIEVARRAGALSDLPLALVSLAEVDFRTGRWWHAYAHADEALRIIEETSGPRGWSLAILAQVEAGQGRAAECIAHASESVETSTKASDRAQRVWARGALGLLQQGLGKPQEALVQFRAQDDDYAMSGLIRQPIWTLERAEALLRCGYTDEARETLDSVKVMDLSANPDDRIRLLRCEGLLASNDDAPAYFEAALAITGESPVDRARTQLAYGQRLRRMQGQAAGTDLLQSALATFTNLGAAGWIAQTERELEAAGAEVNAAPRTSLNALSARELQVASVVAAGASNREVAKTLFLSEKTVESHLRKCFQKLGIRSRVELTRLLIAQERSAS